MKKTFTLLFAFIATSQFLFAQTNPALLTNFKIDNDARSGYKLSWVIANNEVVHKFDLQKSTNGADFTTVAVLNASQKVGTENYAYSDQDAHTNKVMYRIKMVSRGQDVYYSNIVIVSVKNNTAELFTIVGNPVNDKINLRFNESSKQAVVIRIYSIAGNTILDRTLNKVEKNSMVSIPLSASNAPGIYVLEMNNGIEKLTARFVKQ